MNCKALQLITKLRKLRLLKHLKLFIIIAISFPTFYCKLIYSAENTLINLEEKSLSIQEDLYILGPGDILSIKFLDFEEISGDVRILSDGNIQIPIFGDIKVSGLTLSEASLKIKEIVSEELIRPDVQLYVIKQRPIKVTLIGEIENPGVYSLTPKETSLIKGSVNKALNGLPTLVDAIQKSGGITQETNLTNIKLKRKISGPGNKYKKRNINLLNLVKEGDQNENPFLFDGDAIFFEKAESINDSNKNHFVNLSPQEITVTIIGEVVNPGKISLKNGTPVVQAIFASGGPVNWRTNKGNIQLIRINKNGSISKRNFKLNLSQSVSSAKNPVLQNYDIIKVNRNTFAKTTDSINAITQPISGIVTGMSLFKILSD